MELQPVQAQQHFDATFELVRSTLAEIEKEEREDREHEAAATEVGRQQQELRRAQINERLRNVGERVRNLVNMAALFLRLDHGTFSLKPMVDSTRIIEQVRHRADVLSEFIVARPDAIRRIPTLVRFWPDELDERARTVVRDSETFVAAVRTGTVSPRPQLDVLADMVRFLPFLSRGPSELPEEAPEEVIAFCEREGIFNDVLKAVRIALDRAFPDAFAIGLELEHDPERPEAWVVINLRVPDTDTLSRYDRYLTETIASLTPKGLDKIRLLYDVR